MQPAMYWATSTPCAFSASSLHSELMVSLVNGALPPAIAAGVRVRRVVVATNPIARVRGRVRAACGDGPRGERGEQRAEVMGGHRPQPTFRHGLLG